MKPTIRKEGLGAAVQRLVGTSLCLTLMTFMIIALVGLQSAGARVDPGAKPGGSETHSASEQVSSLVEHLRNLSGSGFEMVWGDRHLGLPWTFVRIRGVSLSEVTRWFALMGLRSPAWRTRSLESGFLLYATGGSRSTPLVLVRQVRGRAGGSVMLGFFGGM